MGDDSLECDERDLLYESLSNVTELVYGKREKMVGQRTFQNCGFCQIWSA